MPNVENASCGGEFINHFKLTNKHQISPKGGHQSVSVYCLSKGDINFTVYHLPTGQIWDVNMPKGHLLQTVAGRGVAQRGQNLERCGFSRNPQDITYIE